ncbi:MAG TPA: SAM-dependent chlorinase/fluorinase, partial [Ktedonobacteraceae bacterium]|nr:SAM-dependent chlorinase/fluorinase [Ktedonobacteraceae bacterium]
MTHTTIHPVIALMTDFGVGDGDVGVMKGVIAGIAPDAHIIDITHSVPPQQIASGAWILAAAYRYFPANTVFVCVVDPGVGSTRGAIALHAGEWFFVGPDNGLFSYVLAEQPAHAAALLSNPAYHLQQVSATFHGRDIF